MVADSKRRWTARPTFGRPVIGAAIAFFVAGHASSSAQGAPSDLKVKKPNALLLIDTSGSMKWALDGSDPDCDDGDKGRWAILAETLTGTIGNLRCSDNDALRSNDCRPYLNGDGEITSALASHPSGWPQLTHGPDYTRDAIVFCDNDGGNKCNPGSWVPGKVCKLRSGEWDQRSDGLLDTFSKSIRFGMMTYDSLSVMYNNVILTRNGLPYNHVLGDAGYGRADYCQNGVDGSQCYLDDLYTWSWGSTTDANRQYSYWFLNAGSSWLSGARAGYTGQVRSFAYVTPLIELETFSPEGHLDIGARNPNAPPNLGRLIGFGPDDYDVSDPSITGCASEDDCTARHNEMVQKGILGVSRALDHSTPLGALMRDAQEFILNDDGSRGTHLPHASTLNPTATPSIAGVIGVKADQYYSHASKCRKTAVVLVTDGNPTQDINEKASVFAARLEDADVKTYVVGVAVDKARWSADGLTSVEQDCKLLTESDLTSGMCEPVSSGSLKWKYAELAKLTGLVSGADPDAIEACCTLLDTAVKGGTVKPYFPENQAELKQEFNKVLNEIAGGTLSRTIPVFAAAPANFTSPADNFGAYFELRSSLEVTSDDTMWRGHLERVRYACDEVSGELTPTVQPVETTKGDRFEENLNLPSPTSSRKFFTAIPLDSSVDDDADDGEDDNDQADPEDDAGRHLIGSLRPTLGSPNNHDGLFNGGVKGEYRRLGDVDSNDTDSLVTIDGLASAIDVLGGSAFDAKTALGLDSGDRGTCNDQTGTNNLDRCAERILRWYGGDETPGGDTPSRLPTSSGCEDGFCSALGGIYRSSPVIVPPPQSSDSDDQNFGRVRSNGEESFFQAYSARPTMVYTQTVDGLLHAFTLTTASTNENNELWTFIPPAVIPSVWPNFNSHARLTDGQMAWGNVVYERPYGGNGAEITSVNQTDWDYHTILVVASGPSVVAGFYYALDVTDPSAPRFLWQLSYAGNSNTGRPSDPLFGASAPGAAITHIRYKGKDSIEKILAVAILPGGTSRNTAPGAVMERRLETEGDPYWDPSDSNRHPRRRIRDWGTEGDPSRSLTIVELSSGRVLGRIVGSTADNPRHPSDRLNLGITSLDDYVTVPDQAFDSPITGIPAVYPNGPGKVADRVYVGDADGTMWRVDLASSDPEDWTARIAFDAFNRGNVGSSGESTLRDAFVAAGNGSGSPLGDGSDPDAAATLGQPIQTAPLLSLDEDGHVVVTFATGDQEEFNTVSVGMINMLVSFSDAFIGPTTQSYHARLDDDEGVELAFKDGGRVTGPINLFDGQLYFAYFVPNETDICANGVGGLCGVSYNKRESFEPIGTVDLDDDDTVDQCITFTEGEVVFGISVNLVPSCVVEEDTFDDPWLAGQYKTITQSNLGTYQLSYHTGQGGEAQNGAVTKSSTVNLPAPKSRTRVRTWVSVVE